MAISRVVRAPRAEVYRALIDPAALVRWRVPDDMTAVVHELDPVVGGRFRISLTYRAADRAGKTTGATDTYRGVFAELVPGERVVEVITFETDDASVRGEMTVTTRLADAPGGTEVSIEQAGLPAGVDPGDNAAGTRMSLDALARLLEGRP